MNELSVLNLDGKFFVDSREVAEMVDKRHDNLLRDINGYCEIMTNSNLRTLDFFHLTNYQDSKGEFRPMYLLTRKGCDMVANKMTGEKGVLFTAAYVTKFEEMEKQLTAPKLPTTYLEALEALVAAEKEKQILLPKAEYFDALVERNLLTNFRDTAKELKTKEQAFINWLIEKGYIYRDTAKKLKPYAQYVPNLFEIKESKGEKWVGTQTLITPRGRETFRLLLQERKVSA